jgi:transposase
MELTGFSKIIREAQGKNEFDLEETVKLMVTQRLDLPSSKLRTYERQLDHGFEEIDLHHLYRAMDTIEPLKDQIQGQAFKSACSINNFQVDCFFFDVTTLYFESVTLNQAAIDADAAWDGFHGIAVSNSAKLNTTEALGRYRDLWHVEETFRLAKSTLKARPIFHWASHRIKSHILLCFITLFFERFLEVLLRQKSTPLTPDRIRYSLSKIHTMHFKDSTTNKQGKMESNLPEDAEKIFMAIGISTERTVGTNSGCCA